MLLIPVFILLMLASVSVSAQSTASQIEQLSSPVEGPNLASKLLEESRAPASSAVQAWLNPNPAIKDKARAVLNEMEEAALYPLLHTQGNLSPRDQAWRLTMTVNTLLELRRATAHMLDQQLDNRQPLPMPVGNTEEPEPPRRVCDEAYSLMGKLTDSNAESMEHLLELRRFFNLPEKQRDVQIQHARQSKTWREMIR